MASPIQIPNFYNDSLSISSAESTPSPYTPVSSEFLGVYHVPIDGYYHHPHPTSASPWLQTNSTYASVPFDDPPGYHHPPSHSCHYLDIPLFAPSPIAHQPSSLLTATPQGYQDQKYTKSYSSSQPFPPAYHYPPPSYQSISPQQKVHSSTPSYSTIPTPSDILDNLTGNSNSVTRSRSSAPTSLDHKNETSRKALRKAIARHVGFSPTDIGNITSHEKKRHYLECLEYYVLYLQQRIISFGAHPTKMQRVRPVKGGCMDSKSIRTLLVHMAKANQNLHQQTLDGEQQFLLLRHAASQQSHQIGSLQSVGGCNERVRLRGAGLL